MMAGIIRILILLVLISLAPLSVFAQHSIPSGWDADMALRPVEKQIWYIFGKVTDLRGEPLRAASVRVDLGSGIMYVKTLSTDVQGNFRTEYTLDGKQFKQLAVNLKVEREGYLTAHEFVDFGESNKTWEIDVAMRPDAQGAEGIGVETLVSALAPRLRASLESDASLKPVRKDLQHAIEQFLDEHDSAKSIPLFAKVVAHRPDCADCRTLMGLASLDAGSWNGASRQFGEAAKLVLERGSTPQKVDSLLIIAELENWRGEYDKAAGFLMQAKDQVSKDPLILQELGRTLVFQKNWEAADEYLGQAIRVGASKEAMLLRAHALLEEGDTRAAAAQLKDYMGNQPARDFPLPVHSLYTQIQERLKVESSSKVASVLDQPPNTLAAAIPELRDIEAAANQDELPAILARTGADVQAFFQNFSNTISEEKVREARLGKKGETKDALEEKFQYLLLTRPETWGVGLEEYRTDKNGDRTASKGLNAGLMLTSGFASASLVFHPSYQSGAGFRLLGQQVLEGHRCYAVAFAQRPEKAQIVERFNTDRDSVLVLFQGVAWIDRDTYKIVRLRSDLLAPQPKVRLERQTTEITYQPVQFTQLATALWLPSEVAVTVEWKGRTFRNSHSYSRFKLFNTEVKDKIRRTEPPPATPPS